MSTRPSMKAFLICSCAFLTLPALNAASTSQATDLLPPVQPSRPAAMPQAGAVAWPTPVVAKAVLPTPQNVPLEPATVAVAPGANPFVAVSSPVPTTVPAPATPVAPNPFATAAAPAAAPTQIQVPDAKKVDETALRYYASTRDLKRLGAEMRRLKSLYPDWEAPANLFDQSAPIDEQPLWDLYSAANYTGARAEIARLQTSNPQWKPSADLMSKLTLAEARSLIDRSYQQGNWNAVLASAKQQPNLLTCADMNVMWQVGEALTRTRDLARAFDLYKYILTKCDGQQERLATMQKARLLLPEAGVKSLLSLGRALPDGTSEFAEIAFDGLRQRLGDTAAGKVTGAIPAEDLESFAAFAEQTKSAGDAGQLGWYYYSQKQYEAANAWFNAAATFGDDPKNIEGQVLTLRQMGKTKEAYAIALANVGKSDELRQEYIEVVSAALTDDKQRLSLSDQDLETFKSNVFAANSALGAQALGWHALNEKGVKEAGPLFKQSLKWDVTEGGVIGSAVAAARTKNNVELASLKSEYQDKFQTLRDFKIYSKTRPAKKHFVRRQPEKKKPKSLLSAFFD